MRDFCYIEDVVDAIFLTLENTSAEGEIINIASGVAYRIKDVIEKIREIVGSGVPEYGKVKFRKGENMEFKINLLDKPTLTINEAVMVLNLSSQSVRAKVREGSLKAVQRLNQRDKIQIFTKSIINYIENGGRVVDNTNWTKTPHRKYVKWLVCFLLNKVTKYYRAKLEQ